jgi:hypothetical protein
MTSRSTCSSQAGRAAAGNLWPWRRRESVCQGHISNVKIEAWRLMLDSLTEFDWFFRETVRSQNERCSAGSRS